METTRVPNREEILENVLLLLDGQYEELAVPQVEAYIRMHLGMDYNKSDFLVASIIIEWKRKS